MCGISQTEVGRPIQTMQECVNNLKCKGTLMFKKYGIKLALYWLCVQFINNIFYSNFQILLRSSLHLSVQIQYAYIYYSYILLNFSLFFN